MVRIHLRIARFSDLENTDSLHDQSDAQRRVGHRLDDADVVLFEGVQSCYRRSHGRHGHGQLRLTVNLEGTTSNK